jgi:hypothetical protein
LGAQSASAGQIQGELVYAEGKDFSLVRGNQRSVYAADDPSALGLEIQEGDLLQTGSRTFVEVQLLPRGTVMKIAENSSFLFKGFGAGGEAVSLGLIYGRVRAKVAKVSGSDSFTIRSGNTIAGVRGTDFGVDAILNPLSSPVSGSSSQPTVQIYCFSGEVAVIPSTTEESILPDAPAVTVKKDEMVSVDVSQALPMVERRSLDEQTLAYWTSNDFKGETTVPVPETAPLRPAEPKVEIQIRTVVERVVQIEYVPPDYAPFQRTNAVKNTTIGAGAFFSVAGVVMQLFGFSLINSGDPTLGRELVLSGGIPIGLGVITLVATLFINPPAP